MAVVTLAFPRDAVAGLADRSGFLVPPVEQPGHQGQHLLLREVGLGARGRAASIAILRTSLGRVGEERTLQASDEALVARSLADLAELAGVVAVPGRHARAAMGRRTAAVRRRSPRPRSPGCAPRSRSGWPSAGRGVTESASRPSSPRPVGQPPRSSGHNERVMATKAASIKELNDTIRYTMWSVFKLRDVLGDADRDAEATDVEALFEVAGRAGRGGPRDLRRQRPARRRRPHGLVARGGHRGAAGGLQRVPPHDLRRRLEPVWSQMALHRPAEFNKSHIPAFLADEEPRAHICVYPFVRSYEWYLLEDAERRAMLAEHGQMARDYADVRANTVASFALGDYEWMLAFEADELHRIVDLMRDLRASTARRHVREEVPFYTGARVSPADLLARLP